MWALNRRKFDVIKKALGVTNLDLAKWSDVSAPTLSCWRSRRQNIGNKAKADSLVKAIQNVSKEQGYKPGIALQFGDLFYSTTSKVGKQAIKRETVVKATKKSIKAVNGSGVTPGDIKSISGSLDNARETLLLAMASAEDLDPKALTIYQDISAIRKAVKKLA